MLRNKKGELATRQIVILIVLITSFAVILFFLFRLDLGGESKKQICHNSVVMKTSSSIPGEDAPLNCERTYVCITKDGSCEGLNDPKKYSVNSLEEVYSLLAEEMADCWWMFGEGKVDYIGKKALKKNYCSICSQVYFDDSLNDLKKVENGKISKDDFYDYLASETMGESKLTYAEYMLGTKDVESLKKEFAPKDESISIEGELSFGDIEIGEQYYVMMGITSELTGWAWVGAGIVTAGGTFLLASNPVGWTVTASIIAGSVAGTATGVGGHEISKIINPEIKAIMVEGDDIDNQFMAPTVVKVEPEKFDALNCKEIITKH